MRTTLNIAEEELEFAKDIAKGRGVSLGEAVTGIIRDAMKPGDVEIRMGDHGFPVLHTPGAPMIDGEKVREIWQEEALDQDATLRR